LASPAELKKVRDKKYEDRFLYASFFRRAINYFSEKEPQKREFETTDAYNKRLNDSTDYYLKQYALKETELFIEYINRNTLFDLGSYDADKGFYKVEAGFGKKGNLFGGDGVSGIMAVKPEEAQELKQGGYTFKASPTDVYVKEYFLYPSKIMVVSKTDNDKRYIANFPIPAGSSDIVFRGSEVWVDNPKAKNLVYNYKDLAVEVLEKRKQERAEQERIAEEKRLEQDRIAREKFVQDSIRIEEETAREKEKIRIAEEVRKQKQEWAKRVAPIDNLLILKSPKGDIRFEVGKPFPYDKVVGKEFIIQGKTVSFKYNRGDKRWEVSIDSDIVVEFDGKEKGKIKKIVHYYRVKDYLGYGIFDVK